MLDLGRVAANESRCECGAELDLPGVTPRLAEESPTRLPDVELLTYREAPSASRELPLELAGVGRDLECPRCRVPLENAFHGSGDVSECTTCFGAFVDVEVLTVFVDEARETKSVAIAASLQSPAKPTVSTEGLAKCPCCREWMGRKVFGKRSGVLVDVCETHGTWFDGGELTRALQFSASGGDERVANAERIERRMHQDPLVAVDRGAEATVRQQDARAAARQEFMRRLAAYERLR